MIINVDTKKDGVCFDFRGFEYNEFSDDSSFKEINGEKIYIKKFFKIFAYEPYQNKNILIFNINDYIELFPDADIRLKFGKEVYKFITDNFITNTPIYSLQFIVDKILQSYHDK